MSDIEKAPAEILDETVPGDAIDDSDLDIIAGGVGEHSEAT